MPPLDNIAMATRFGDQIAAQLRHKVGRGRDGRHSARDDLPQRLFFLSRDVFL